MMNFKYVITDAVGIHARPAGMLVKEVKKYASKIVIVKGEKQAEATKLMAIMGLGVKCNDEIEIQVTGDDEELAAAGMKKFFEENL